MSYTSADEQINKVSISASDTITVLQHDCNRLTNAMQSCLEIVVEKADIILFQESWISRELTTVLYSSFYNIISSESELTS